MEKLGEMPPTGGKINGADTCPAFCLPFSAPAVHRFSHQRRQHPPIPAILAERENILIPCCHDGFIEQILTFTFFLVLALRLTATIPRLIFQLPSQLLRTLREIELELRIKYPLRCYIRCTDSNAYPCPKDHKEFSDQPDEWTM